MRQWNFSRIFYTYSDLNKFCKGHGHKNLWLVCECRENRRCISRTSSRSMNVFFSVLSKFGGMWWHSWLKHCATSWKVGIFHWDNPSSRTTAVVSTQSITKVSKGKVNWSCYRPGVAQRVGRCIALLFHDRGTRRGWVFSSTPRPHFTPGKDPVLINRNKYQEYLFLRGGVVEVPGA